MERPVIDRFSGPYRFLSNFFPAPIRYPVDDPDAPLYRTLEHAFQAAKSLDPDERARVRDVPSPGVAKAMGRRIGGRRPDWGSARLEVMRELLRAKFSQEPLRSRLLETGDAELVEGNVWHDQFWGSCRCARHAGTRGLNLLGRLLMEIRDELAGRPIDKRVTEPSRKPRTTAASARGRVLKPSVAPRSASRGGRADPPRG